MSAKVSAPATREVVSPRTSAEMERRIFFLQAASNAKIVKRTKAFFQYLLSVNVLKHAWRPTFILFHSAQLPGLPPAITTPRDPSRNETLATCLIAYRDGPSRSRSGTSTGGCGSAPDDYHQATMVSKSIFGRWVSEQWHVCPSLAPELHR